VHCKACLIEAFELGAVDVMLRKKRCWKEDWGVWGRNLGLVMFKVEAGGIACHVLEYEQIERV